MQDCPEQRAPHEITSSPMKRQDRSQSSERNNKQPRKRYKLGPTTHSPTPAIRSSPDPGYEPSDDEPLTSDPHSQPQPSPYCIHTAQSISGNIFCSCPCPGSPSPIIRNLNPTSGLHRPFTAAKSSPILIDLGIEVHYPTDETTLTCGNATCTRLLGPDFELCLGCFTPLCDTCRGDAEVQGFHLVRVVTGMEVSFEGIDYETPYESTALRSALEGWREETETSSDGESDSSEDDLEQPIPRFVPIQQDPRSQFKSLPQPASILRGPPLPLQQTIPIQQNGFHQNGIYNPSLIPNGILPSTTPLPFQSTQPHDPDLALALHLSKQQPTSISEKRLARAQQIIEYEADMRKRIHKYMIAGGRESDTDPSGGEGPSDGTTLRVDPRVRRGW